VRALITIGGNPITSFPNHHRTVEVMQQLEVLAVTELTAGEMTEAATHVLPCAGPLERADVNHLDAFQPEVFGQFSPAVLGLTGERRPMWWFMSELGRRLALEILPDGLDGSASDAEVLQGLFPAPRRAFDEVAANPGGVVVTGTRAPWFADTVIPGGRWNLEPGLLAEQLAQLDVSNAALSLISRRPRHQVNSTLRGLAGEGACLYIHETDAVRAGIENGANVMVRSRHGAVETTAVFDATLRPGVVAMSQGDLVANINLLTSELDDVDNVTSMPLFTAIPVSVAPAVHDR
jgi:anaerobic selenocysteine-containing dehydrogenase